MARGENDSRLNYQQVIGYAIGKKVDGTFTTKNVLDSVPVSKPYAIAILKSMNCLGKCSEITRSVISKPGPKPQGWIVTDKPKGVVCNDCILNDAEAIQNGGKYCQFTSKGRKKPIMSNGQVKIVGLISQGVTTNAKIAERLGIARGTVANQLNKIYRRIENEKGSISGSKVAALNFALKNKLIEL